MDLNLLRVFVAVYEEGSLSAAAVRLHLTQPTVTHSCNRLRRQYGDPLFVRTGRGVTPTVFAESLYRDIAEPLAAMENVASHGGFDPTTSTHRFALALSDIGESVFLPEILARMHAAAPGVTIEVQPVNVETAADLLARGGCDAVITSGELRGRTHSEIIRTDRYRFVHHPAASDPLRAGRYTEVPFVFGHPSLGHHPPVRHLLKIAGMSGSRYSTVQNFSSLPAILASLPGATVAPGLIAQHWRQQWPGLEESPLPAEEWNPEVRLHRRVGSVNPALTWFYGFVLEAARGVSDLVPGRP